MKIENRKDAPGFLAHKDSKTSDKMMTQFLHDKLNRHVKKNNPLQWVCDSLAAFAHGPAQKKCMQEPVDDATHSIFFAYLNSGSARVLSNIDLVCCIRCLLWPPQAANWLSRSRHHGVPDQTTIDMVVSNGCDVVGAVHPLCRQDEWMNKYQWRLSFSRAEVTLLNSWTPVQQIIYHMLRFVIKREGLTKTNENDPDLQTLSNYNIKTLMLWECEEKPQSWWSAQSSLIKLCSSLLHKLCDWVADKRCQHYFISNCNLIDFQDASLTICYNLRCIAN